MLLVKDWGEQWFQVLLSVASATIGVIALAGGLFGWFAGPTRMWQRGVLVVAALALIKPGSITDLIGLGLLLIVIVAQKMAPVREPT